MLLVSAALSSVDGGKCVLKDLKERPVYLACLTRQTAKL